MFKKLFGTAVLTAVAAAGVKVVKDILDADEEDNKLIQLDTENEAEEAEAVEEAPVEE